MKKNIEEVRSALVADLETRFELPMALEQVNSDGIYSLSWEVYDKLSSHEVKHWEVEFNKVDYSFKRWEF